MNINRWAHTRAHSKDSRRVCQTTPYILALALLCNIVRCRRAYAINRSLHLILHHIETILFLYSERRLHNLRTKLEAKSMVWYGWSGGTRITNSYGSKLIPGLDAMGNVCVCMSKPYSEMEHNHCAADVDIAKHQHIQKRLTPKCFAFTFVSTTTTKFQSVY